tara:strand:+ start:696 stop:1196 length:501 start_codon:yes stop_codon:yes gene_type:complete
MEIAFERYATIKEYPNYLFGSEGNIVSLWHKKPYKRSIINDKNGYRNLRFTNIKGNKVTRWLHRLICEAFHGSCPTGLECSHKDGNRHNNTSANLEWVTHKENCARRVEHGTSVKGRKFKCFEKDTVLEIRRRLASGENFNDLAKEYDRSPRIIQKIKNRESYKNI